MTGSLDRQRKYRLADNGQNEAVIITSGKRNQEGQLVSPTGGVESGWSVAAPPYRALESGDPATVGRYRLDGVLGEGGMGRVYLGRTPAGVAVAVKVLHRELAADGGFRKRFAQEIATVRGVQGLYTVPVVDADPLAERPWLASAYVAGPSLRHAVTEDGPGSPDAVLRLVAIAAEALQSLHAAGVVHRSFKPSNVLLTADGLRLTDFGIAHVADGTSVTGTGVPAGTPAYLAPEYIRGEEITGAADVFALGVSAYFAATGRLAFGGGPAHVVTYRVMEQEPVLEGCPEPLRDIVMACLHKDPRQRPTPADIMRQCGAGHLEPPPAAPPAPQLIEAAATQPAIQAPPGLPPHHPQYASASGPRGLTRRRLLLGAAGLAGAAGLGVAIPLLLSDNSGNGGTDDSGGRSVNGPFRLAATITTDHAYEINGVAFSPDGRQLATVGGDVRLWDVATSERRAILDGVLNVGLAFSPDGRLLATAADEDRSVRLWDVAARKPQATLTGHTGDIGELAFSPDGQLLATASADETVRLWDVRSGRQRAVLGGHNTAVGGVDFHPGGRILASCASWGVFLWDIPSGRQHGILDNHENLWNVAYSPDGTILAAADAGAGDAGGSVVFWDTEVVGRQNAVFGGHESPMRELVFSPDGKLLVTAGEEQVKVWDVASRKQRAAFDTEDSFNEVAFSSTGMLATTQGVEVRLWKRG